MTRKVGGRCDMAPPERASSHFTVAMSIDAAWTSAVLVRPWLIGVPLGDPSLMTPAAGQTGPR